ncbi:MAG: hypothetical protein AAF734_12335 [Bacteroidota bacterium]
MIVQNTLHQLLSVTQFLLALLLLDGKEASLLPAQPIPSLYIY